MMKYIIDTVNEKDYTAGSKARSDIAEILKEQGFVQKNIVVGKDKKRVFSEVRKIRSQLKDVLEKMEAGSYVFVQYPWPTLSFAMAEDIQKAAKRKKLYTAVIIHDLNSVRTGSSVTRFYYDHYVREIDFLNIFDVIIAHNRKMKEYLVSKGIHAEKIVSLEIFDYLGRAADRHGEQYAFVNIAGNLRQDKTGYVYHLDEVNVNFHLYGPSYTGITNDHIIYEGSVPSDELPAVLNEGFGLVWDGNEIETCGGSFGRYLRLNNPHKLSLYMASGIPVFIWKDAAEADFVEENHVGYKVSSLNDIHDILGNMTLEKYRRFLTAAALIQARVRNGYYTKEALKNAQIIWNRQN